eukprot:3652331-Pyramimonas_sp.AAC.1
MGRNRSSNYPTLPLSNSSAKLGYPGSVLGYPGSMLGYPGSVLGYPGLVLGYPGSQQQVEGSPPGGPAPWRASA